MIVCSCNVISDHAIRAVVERTLGNPQPAHEIYRSLGYVPDCGRCARSVKQVIKDAMGEAAYAGRAACGGLEQPVADPCIDESGRFNPIHADSSFDSVDGASCGPDCCQNRNRTVESLPGLTLDAGRASVSSLALGAAPEAMAQAAE